MTKHQNHAETVAKEEAEAQAQEGMARISDGGFELIERYLELNREAASIKLEKDAIADLIKEEMKQKGVSALTHDGRVAVELVKSTSTKADIASIRSFFPEIAAKFIHTSDTIRFDVKK